MIKHSLIETAYFSPNNLNFPNSWMGHLPFANWLIKQIAPKIFVELGTHSGNSYFAFCQAVLEGNISTKCYAVDTWQGDEHAGYYGKEVFNQVNPYNQLHYAGFSRLMRMTFDEAKDYFADGSIELLHIDGLHTYESVKHDFETWLPKLTKAAIVLFHDINVREHGFGVWKLWEELQTLYPLNFEFTHSHGLGVIQIGSDSPKKQLSWIFSEKEDQQILKNYFSAIGARQIERYEIFELRKNIAECNVQTDNLNQIVSNLSHQKELLDQQIISLNEETVNRGKWALGLDAELKEAHQKLYVSNNRITKLVEEITSFTESLADQDKQIVNLIESINNLEEQISTLNQTVAECDKQIVTLNDEIVRRGEWGLGLDAELVVERERLNNAYARLNDVVKSNSWRITLPLREARLWALKPAYQSKRYAKKSFLLAKQLYQALPFNQPTIEKHRQTLVKYAPKLLSTTETRFDGKSKGTISLESVEDVNNINPFFENSFFDHPDEHINNAKTIEIDISDNPLVSVIIPIYGKIYYTLNCLASIAANPSQIPFEVIVVDDCSPDISAEVLAHVKGIRLIQNEQNQGFIRSCNKGAKAAKGKYLHFLNNDTQVTSGWMDELARTFHEFPGTGLVGSKLIYPDGRLQEAGGIIWQDGSAWNFGRFQDPQLPIFNYAREVDYCSGASIMVQKSLFDELGGFDEQYLPAYCEDSDLALKIREKGHRVIYQPLSTIIHFEGISSGTDINEGVKAYQVENTKKLYSQWQDRLSAHQSPGIDVDKAKDRRAKHRVLVLEHCTPTPNQDAGSVTVYNLLLLLREMDFQVTFIPEDNFLYMPEYTTALQRIGVEVLYAPYVTSVEQHLKEYGDRYDLAFLFRPLVVERNIQKIREYSPQSKTLYYTHDLHFLRMAREAELFQDTEKQQLADEMKIRELKAIKLVDASILVSEQELEIVQSELADENKDLHTLPLILNINGTTKGLRWFN